MKDYTTDSPKFSESIKILEPTDAGHADNVNVTTEQLLQNTLVLYQRINEKMDEIMSGVTEDLADYYTAAQVDQKISAIPKFDIEVKEALPTSNISETTVYLVKSGTESQNLYTEYIYVNGTWEKLGTQKVDLSGYSTKANTLQGAKAKDAKTITFTRGDGSTFDITITGAVMKGATTSAAGAAGTVPAPAAGAANRYLCSDGTWKIPLALVNNLLATVAGSALDATQGKVLNDKITKLNTNVIPSYVSYNMAAGSWNAANKTYSFEGTYPKASYNLEIEPANTCTNEQLAAWSKAQILGSATDNVLTAKGTVPAVNIPVILKVFKKQLL